MLGLWVIGAFFFGLLFGSVTANCRWRSNSESPARIMEGHRFYKVVEIGNDWSAEMLSIHTPEIWSQKDQEDD